MLDKNQEKRKHEHEEHAKKVREQNEIEANNSNIVKEDSCCHSDDSQIKPSKKKEKGTKNK